MTRSLLLMTRRTMGRSGVSGEWGIRMSGNCLLGSVSRMMMSALRAACRERSIPICSMRSVVLRMPAVSMKRKVMPSICMVSSMRSRVVPWMSETMARSSCTRAFMRVLLPTLGAPMMATGMPVFRALPVRKESVRRCMCL